MSIKKAMLAIMQSYETRRGFKMQSFSMDAKYFEEFKKELEINIPGNEFVFNGVITSVHFFTW